MRDKGRSEEGGWRDGKQVDRGRIESREIETCYTRGKRSAKTKRPGGRS